MRASLQALFRPFMCWAAGFSAALAIAAAIDGLPAAPLFTAAAGVVHVAALVVWFRHSTPPPPCGMMPRDP